eukprot:5199858-Pleurochrysis_carterae.AAC.1
MGCTYPIERKGFPNGPLKSALFFSQAWRLLHDAAVPPLPAKGALGVGLRRADLGCCGAVAPQMMILSGRRCY